MGMYTKILMCYTMCFKLGLTLIWHELTLIVTTYCFYFGIELGFNALEELSKYYSSLRLIGHKKYPCSFIIIIYNHKEEKNITKCILPIRSPNIYGYQVKYMIWNGNTSLKGNLCRFLRWKVVHGCIESLLNETLGIHDKCLKTKIDEWSI